MPSWRQEYSGRGRSIKWPTIPDRENGSPADPITLDPSDIPYSAGDMVVCRNNIRTGDSNYPGLIETLYVGRQYRVVSINLAGAVLVEGDTEPRIAFRFSPIRR